MLRSMHIAVILTLTATASAGPMVPISQDRSVSALGQVFEDGSLYLTDSSTSSAPDFNMFLALSNVEPFQSVQALAMQESWIGSSGIFANIHAASQAQLLADPFSTFAQAVSELRVGFTLTQASSFNLSSSLTITGEVASPPEVFMRLSQQSEDGPQIAFHAGQLNLVDEATFTGILPKGTYFLVARATSVSADGTAGYATGMISLSFTPVPAPSVGACFVIGLFTIARGRKRRHAPTTSPSDRSQAA